MRSQLDIIIMNKGRTLRSSSKITKTKFFDEETQESFLTKPSLDYFHRIIKTKSLIIERQFTLKATDLENYDRCFLQMPVGKLLQGVGEPLLLPTRVFYANIVNENFEEPSFDTLVHGRKIKVNKDIIRQVLNLGGDSGDLRIKVFEELSAEETAEISKLLTGTALTSEDVITLSMVPLFVRIFVKIIRYNIVPSSTKHEVIDQTTARILYHILSQHKVDWAALIIEMMIYVCREGINLGYPRLIHQLCLASGVTFRATDICDKEPLPFSKRMINQAKGHLPKEVPTESTTAGGSSSKSHKGKAPKEAEPDSEVTKALMRSEKISKKTMRQVSRNYKLDQFLYGELHQLATHQGHPELFNKAQYDSHNAQFPAEFDSPAREDEEED